jgi:hypothetical protein
MTSPYMFPGDQSGHQIEELIYRSFVLAVTGVAVVARRMGAALLFSPRSAVRLGSCYNHAHSLKR